MINDKDMKLNICFYYLNAKQLVQNQQSGFSILLNLFIPSLYELFFEGRFNVCFEEITVPLTATTVYCLRKFELRDHGLEFH
jgi:hypothetical protein